MSKRFGRNQKRKLREEISWLERRVRGVEFQLAGSRKSENETNARLAEVVRAQLTKGTIPLEVEHFISRDGRNIIMHAIYVERGRNLHYKYEASPKELQLKRDEKEREQFAMYLGRAIADRLADASAGADEGTSRVAA